MIESINKLLGSVLTALYQPFLFSVVLTIFLMFFYLYAKEKGLKPLIKKWISEFKTDVKFRKILFFTFYTVMILFNTLFARNLWNNPLMNPIGVWSIVDANGKFQPEIIVNLALFTPFIFLLFWSFGDRLLKKFKLCSVLWQSIKIVFLFSLSIEILQLLLRIGTFQLSDLFFNTLGGLIGGLIYWAVFKIINKRASAK